MLKKTYTFTDFNGADRTEDFYFNLTEAEITEMELSIDGGLVQYINKISASKSAPELIALFKDIIKKSYGVKSDDGRRFIKNDSVFEEFAQTNAYSALFMELAFNASSAAAFVNGIVPTNKSAAISNVI